MRVADLRWQSYRIPFRGDFVTARGAMASREGAIVTIKTDDGRIGRGDAAPLPVYGGTLRDALHLLQEVGPTLIGGEVADLMAAFEATTRRHRYHDHVYASVACSLDLACCDLLAQQDNLSIAAWLAGPRGYAPVVAVNATVGSSTVSEAVDEARRAASSGFRCLKLKVGTVGDPDADARRVAAVRDAIGPRVELRLDANGAWSLDQALRLLPRLRSHNIQLIEQPVADLADLARLRAACRLIPVAADESVTSVERAQTIIAVGAADVLVVKPVVVGGIRPAHAIARLAEAAGLGVVVTSMLESGVGVAGALHVAATLRQPAWACGLATTALLESDLLVRPLEVDDAAMRLPSGPGLGVTVAPALLDRYAAEPVGSR